MDKKIIATVLGVVCIVAISVLAFTTSRKAEFVVSAIEYTPDKVFEGENVTITVSIKNVGNIRGTYEAVLMLNNVKMSAKKISLDPGKEENIIFSIIAGKKGNYTVKVGEKTILLTIHPRIFQGAFLEYKVEGIALFLPISGSLRLEIVEVTDQNYTVLMTPIGIPFAKPQTIIYKFGEVAAPLANVSTSNMQNVDEEFIQTSIGMQKVLHYYSSENITETGIVKMHSYIDKDTGLPLLIQTEGPGYWLKVEISDTNMEWLKR